MSHNISTAATYWLTLVGVVVLSQAWFILYMIMKFLDGDRGVQFVQKLNSPKNSNLLGQADFYKILRVSNSKSRNLGRLHCCYIF